MGILNDLAEFLITPLFRWIALFLSTILGIVQYLNGPQRFSYTIASSGLSYKWHLYGIAVFSGITTMLTYIGLWSEIPFTNYLPDYWYLYIFILYLAIITQITIDSKQYSNDGSFNPPPSYLLPQEYRVLLAYISFVFDTLIMIQLYIYFGVADTTKKTILSTYFLERFGGWIPGNKLDFIFDWSGLIDTSIKVYIILLQTSFNACEYDLPTSWNS
jgi:hypothetical protein